MNTLKNLYRNHRVFAFLVVILILFVAADRADYYHINLKGDLVGVNTALKNYPLYLKNKDANLIFRVDSSGAIKGTSYLAGVDSFLTTATADTIQIKGVTTASVFVINGKTFDYSPGLDSVIYSYRLKTDTLIVTRYRPQVVSGGTVKSGGQYSYIRIVK